MSRPHKRYLPRAGTTSATLRRSQTQQRTNTSGGVPGMARAGGIGQGGGRPGARGGGQGSMGQQPNTPPGGLRSGGLDANQAMGQMRTRQARQNLGGGGAPQRRSMDDTFRGQYDRAMNGPGGDPRTNARPGYQDEDSLFRRQHARALNTREQYLRNHNNVLGQQNGNPMIRSRMQGFGNEAINAYGAPTMSLLRPEMTINRTGVGGDDAVVHSRTGAKGSEGHADNMKVGTIASASTAGGTGSSSQALTAAPPPDTENAPTNSGGGGPGMAQNQTGTIESGQTAESGSNDPAKIANDMGISEDYVRQSQESGNTWTRNDDGSWTEWEGDTGKVAESLRQFVWSKIDFQNPNAEAPDGWTPTDAGGMAGEIYRKLSSGESLTPEESAWMRENGIGARSYEETGRDARDQDWEASQSPEDDGIDFWEQYNKEFGELDMVDGEGKAAALRAQGESAANEAFAAAQQQMQNMGSNPGVTGAVGARTYQQQRMQSEVAAESVKLQAEMTNLQTKTQHRQNYIQMLMARAQMEQNEAHFQKAQQLAQLQRMDNMRMEKLRMAAAQAQAQQSSMNQVWGALGSAAGMIFGGPIGGALVGGGIAAGNALANQPPANYAGAGGGGYYTSNPSGGYGAYQPGLAYKALG